MTTTSSAFALPDRLAAKAESSLIATDEKHFRRISDSLERSIDDLTTRLDVLRAAPAGTGQEALERDLEIYRMTSRRRALGRYGLDLCLGRMVNTEGESVYVGRFGLTDDDGTRLLLDWRTPAAEPFFGATHATPMGLSSRRRYRWTRGVVTDYWDEVFTPDGGEGHAALDDQSAFITSLGSSRSPRMRDVLGTIQADQDAIIRAGSRGALVVDGGPGTGKTVVALHRTAYLLYADPRLGRGHGGVLFVGPHAAYLAYVADVLPSLGEEGVQTCTVHDLVPEGETAGVETDPDTERIKASIDVVAVIDAAVAHYERLPARGMTIETPWQDVWIDVSDWAEAFAAAESGMTHNEARGNVWEALLTIVVDLHDDEEAPPALVRRSLIQNEALRAAFARAWPLVDPVGVVADLWSVPAYLRQSAPWLTESEVQALQRSTPREWTTADIPFLDLARRRAGDPEASRRQQRRDAEVAAEQERMSRVIDTLIDADADEDGVGLVTMLRSQDVQNSLIDESAVARILPDQLAGPFSHIVVDEAQELSDAEWAMLVQRCPSRSFTIVGDRAQARHGFTESWRRRLARVGIDQVTLAGLTINYRTPSEVMAVAEPVIREALPDANVPVSIRESGIAVRYAPVSELADIVGAWIAEHDEGVACVIGDPTFPEAPRVRSLTPVLAKGLEFDLVVLVDPDTFGAGIEGAVDRYVAMTRATQQLVILTS